MLATAPQALQASSEDIGCSVAGDEDVRAKVQAESFFVELKTLLLRGHEGHGFVQAELIFRKTALRCPMFGWVWSPWQPWARGG